MKPASAPLEITPQVGDEAWVDAARALREEVRQGFERSEVSKGETPKEDGRAVERPATGSNRRGPMRPGKLVPLRQRMQARQLGTTFRFIDMALILALAVWAVHLATPGGVTNARFTDMSPFLMGGLAMAWGLGVLQAYKFPHREPFWLHLARVIGATALSIGFFFFGLAMVPGDNSAARALAPGYALAVAGLFALHGVWWMLVARWRRNGRLTPNVIIVGANDMARQLIETALKTREVFIIGIFDDRLDRAPDAIEGVPVLGDTAALLNHKVLPYVDQIVITVSSMAQARVSQLIQRLGVLPNQISLVMDNTPTNKAAALSRIADAPLSRVSGAPTNERRAIVKRVQDVVVGVVALILSVPIMLVVAIAIRMDSPGPIFFRQRRHGFHNEEILVWKFRSMRQETTDAAAVRQVSADDDRVTKVGKFIRRTSLDELPQLFNVMAGEMSLVGPRPHAVGMKTGQTESARLVAEYAHRHRMKPGMTGWAAIHGSRGPIDTPQLVRRRVALDVEYIERQSFWMDFYIMAMTIPCLLGDRSTVR